MRVVLVNNKGLEYVLFTDEKDRGKIESKMNSEIFSGDCWPCTVSLHKKLGPWKVL